MGPDRLHSRVREMPTRAERAVGLGGQVAAPILFDQLFSVTERVEVDLVGDGGDVATAKS